MKLISDFLEETTRIKSEGSVASFNDIGEVESYCLLGALGCELGLITDEYDADYYDDEPDRLKRILLNWGVTKESVEKFYTPSEIENALEFVPGQLGLNDQRKEQIHAILFSLNDQNTNLDFKGLAPYVRKLEKAGLIKYEKV